MKPKNLLEEVFAKAQSEVLAEVQAQHEDELAQLKSVNGTLVKNFVRLREDLYNALRDLGEAVEVGLIGDLGRDPAETHRLSGWYRDAEISLEWIPGRWVYRWDVWHPMTPGGTITGEGTDSVGETIQMVKSAIDKVSDGIAASAAKSGVGSPAWWEDEDIKCALSSI